MQFLVILFPSPTPPPPPPLFFSIEYYKYKLSLLTFSHTEVWISDEINVNIAAASCYKANRSSKMKETMFGSNQTIRKTTKMRGLNFEV